MKTGFVVRSLAFVFALSALSAFATEYHSTASFRCNTPAANSADSAWMARHAEKVAAVADASVKKDFVFIGDELTADWETTGAAALATYFTGDKTMFNLGFAGDCTEHALWRIKNGELGNPKAIFLMIGGNNTATYLESEEAPGQTSVAVRDIIDYIRFNHGTTKLVVQAILPRGADESDPVRARNDQVNNDIRKYVQSVGCTWVDMSDLFLESDHHTLKTSLYNADKATLNADGYAVWGQAVQGYVTAAVNGTAMPSDLVATARPSGVPVAAYPSFSTIVLDQFYWQKFDYDVFAIRNKSYDIVLLGDSITQKWSGTDPSSMSGLAASVFNLGRSGDFTENLFWRLNSGCLDGYTTKYFNLLIGTNNTVQREPSMDSPEDIAAGVKAVIDLVLAKHPESKILLMPILPYGSKSNPADAAAKHANNVAANEIIKTYADNRRVFLVNLDTSKFYLSDGSCNPEMYDATEAGLYYLHLSAKGYSEIIAPAIKSAMASTAALPVSYPQVGSVSAKVTDTAATLTLSDVVKGTDASGAAASSYKVTYKLDTAAETTLAANETGDSATVGLADLADGWHTCAVSVSADGVVKSAVKRVKFQIDTNADQIGWKVAPMDADGSAFRDDGTQIFARGYTGKTVNGITFSSGFPSSEQATVSPSTYSGAGWGENNPVFSGGWVWSKSGSQDVVFTLKGLTSGHKYCVQILAANHWSGSSTTLSAGDLTPFEATKNNDYKYGAVFTRVFVASGSTEDVTIGFSGSNNNCLIKAVQLRELGAGSEEDPPQEDDPVDPPQEDDPEEPVIPTEYGWKVNAMTASADLVIEKQGTFLYGYRGNSSALTVDEVTFAAGNDTANMNIAFSSAFANAGENSGGGFGNLLATAWNWGASQSALTVTLNGLTKDHVYLVQILAHNGWGDPTITVGEETPVRIGSGAKAANIVGTFKAEGTTAGVELKFGGGAAKRMVNAIQVRELSAGEPIVPADAPIIGGEGVEVPMAVLSDKVSITIGNAAAGHTYGYRKSATLEGLATAEVIKLDSPAATAGVLTLDIQKDPAEPTCFYRIVVE